jgi:hypothetical protein
MMAPVLDLGFLILLWSKYLIMKMEKEGQNGEKGGWGGRRERKENKIKGSR